MRRELVKRQLLLEDSLSQMKVSVTGYNCMDTWSSRNPVSLQIAWLKIQHVIFTQEGYLPLVSSHIMMLSKLQVIFP